VTRQAANVPSAVVPAIEAIVARESHGRARCHILLRLLLGVREFFAARAIPGKLKHVLSLLHCARAEGFMICGVWRADAGVWPYAGMIGRGFEAAAAREAARRCHCSGLRRVRANNCDRLERPRPRRFEVVSQLEFQQWGGKRSFDQAA
jgi:hypothetical protein